MGQRHGRRQRARLSAANSLVGSTANDEVGRRRDGAEQRQLRGQQPQLDDGAAAGVARSRGAAARPASAVPSVPRNSLVGSTANDQVGSSGVTALSNGNYVVSSIYWNNGGHAGAVTWGSGTAGVTRPRQCHATA